MTIEERDEKDFKENGTIMPKTVRDMYDYDSSLARIIDIFNEQPEPKLDVNDQLLVYNFLKDLEMYRKFCGPFTEMFKMIK